MPRLSAKPKHLIWPGVRCCAAAGLLALLAPPAHADEAVPVCALDIETPSGLITIDPRDGSDGKLRYSLKLVPQSELVGADGSTADFEFFAMVEAPLTRDRIPAVLDSMLLTLRFGDARQVKAPALIYYTRDNTIPLDIAPAKLWYPEYHVADDRLEIAAFLGDLERDMEFGPGEEPASVLSWIAKRIGTSVLDEEVVAFGQVPLAPLREARKAMGAALERIAATPANAVC